MDDYSKYLKIPWRDRGRDYDGCDCWGWVRLFLRAQCGIEISDLQYSSCRNMEEMRQVAEAERQKWRFVPTEMARKGDVVDLHTPGRDAHVGVMVTDRHIGHLERQAFPVIIPLNSLRIKNRIRGIYRYAG